jgi:hypothetical protein
MLEKKIWANFQRTIELFTQKNVAKLSRIWVSGRNGVNSLSPIIKKYRACRQIGPGSKIRDPEKAYS